MINTGFHLPHNAIIPDEVKFILNQIDISREYYLYDDLKALMFEEEIKQNVFQKFHPGMYKNFINDERLYNAYKAIKNGTKKAAVAFDKREPIPRFCSTLDGTDELCIIIPNSLSKAL